MVKRPLARTDTPPDRLARSLEGGVARFHDLHRVRTLADVVGDSGEIVPAGSVGTVVVIWARGRAYEVEFAEPIDALATVETALLELVERTLSIQ